MMDVHVFLNVSLQYCSLRFAIMSRAKTNVSDKILREVYSAITGAVPQGNNLIKISTYFRKDWNLAKTNHKAPAWPPNTV